MSVILNGQTGITANNLFTTNYLNLYPSNAIIQAAYYSDSTGQTTTGTSITAVSGTFTPIYSNSILTLLGAISFYGTPTSSTYWFFIKPYVYMNATYYYANSGDELTCRQVMNWASYTNCAAAFDLATNGYVSGSITVGIEIAESGWSDMTTPLDFGNSPDATNQLVVLEHKR